jgi:DhnA family fructose-bisphosphate aldolase class Ia
VHFTQNFRFLEVSRNTCDVYFISRGTVNFVQQNLHQNINMIGHLNEVNSVI